MTNPFLSIVVVSYNMKRELPRTLYSLSSEFQIGLDRDEYEVILVDNGSKYPPQASEFEDLNMDLTIYSIENPTHSPVAAINLGLNNSIGEYVGVFIDGARILSPGLLRSARTALQSHSRSIVAARGRYLGFKSQREAIKEGYDQQHEDRLLDSINWRNNGYDLFDISVFDESSGPTWLDKVAESNAIFMSREMWAELGGYDPAFNLKGGGLVNLDTWHRALKLPDSTPILLMGEATFHQIHGGAATNGSLSLIREFYDHYLVLRGDELERPKTRLTFYGAFQRNIPAHELYHSEKLARAYKPSIKSRVRLGLSRLILQHIPPTLKKTTRPLSEALGAILNSNPKAGLSKLRLEYHHARLIEESGYFDAHWYLQCNPDVEVVGYSPALHYLRFGVSQKRQPGPRFDAIKYLENNYDVKESGQNPLLHFLLYGNDEGRRPTARLDLRDPVGVESESQLQEFIALVRSTELMDPNWYRLTYPGAVATGMDPAEHFVRYWYVGKFNPGPQFDAVRYLAENPDVGARSMNPLVHYLTIGKSQGRRVYQLAENVPAMVRTQAVLQAN